MAFKIFLLVALLGYSNAAFTHQPQSAASPGQLAYAISQNYDQTGPGAHLPPVQQETSTTPQEFTTQQQTFQQQFNQQPYHQQGYTLHQQYTNQPQEYNNQPHAYSSQQQVFATQPQVYSSQPHSHLNYAQPQISYSHASPSFVPVAQPLQMTYSQVATPQASPISYPHAPQIVYSFSPHMPYPPPSTQVLKTTSLKAVQPEIYDANSQYIFSFNTQHDGTSGDSKGQEELPQGAYALMGAEGHRELNNAYSPLLQRPTQPKNYISAHHQPAYIAPSVKPVYNSPVSQQFFTTSPVSKNVYSAPSASRNSLLSGPKNLYSSYLSKFSSPLLHQ